jgi:hypothetical protein
MEELTALISRNLRSDRSARILARVVLPVPGGP